MPPQHWDSRREDSGRSLVRARHARSAVSALKPIAWRIIGAILGRVGDALKEESPPLKGLNTKLSRSRAAPTASILTSR